jgi:DNA helicase-2/ATP-dependent DNA helicase PcrA
VTLEALRTIRQKLREYHPNDTPHLMDFLEFIRMHRELQTSITSVHRRSDTLEGAINLMTAHKSKGLEYEVVYIIGAIDTAWGERVRSRNRLINYPENLHLAPAGNTYDERLRLFFVAMTRAKSHLIISYGLRDNNGKDTLPASFLLGTSLVAEPVSLDATIPHLEQQAALAWHDTLTHNPTKSMREMILPQLETYKLSVTHLNNFIDVTRGGPTTFLLANLLHFPKAKSPSASYGTAIHAVLQRAHNHLAATGEFRPVEDILGDFANELASQHLPASDFALYHKKGVASLSAYLKTNYHSFKPTQKTELNFGNQAVTIDNARLTGVLDLVDIADKKITVTDYKTGKPSLSWKGNQDYEKVKLHKYKQQLMFYQLLTENSRDYSRYASQPGVLQFVEPDTTGAVRALTADYTEEELDRFRTLICAVWKCITTFELPDISEFEQNYKGVLAFEQSLIDKYL